MYLRRFAGTSAVVCALVLALSMQFAAAATKQALLGNTSFEVPKVPADNFATFPTGTTIGTCGLAMPGTTAEQLGCWRVFGGDVDVVQSGYWKAKVGKQSLELNGDTPGDILQLFRAKPDETYHLKFSLAGDPLIDGDVTLIVVQEQFDAAGNYITGYEIGSYGFDTTGHTGTNMGYVPETAVFTTASNAAYSDIEFQSTTQNNSALYWGPVIDQVVLKDQGPGPQ